QEHEFAATQYLVAGAARIGKPGQGLEGMAHDHGSRPATDLTVVDAHVTGEGGEIELLPVPHRSSQHAAGVEKVVGNQGAGAERAVVRVTVIDDLDSHHDGPHMRGQRAARVAAALRSNVLADLDDDPTFDAHLALGGARTG